MYGVYFSIAIPILMLQYSYIEFPIKPHFTIRGGET